MVLGNNNREQDKKSFAQVLEIIEQNFTRSAFNVAELAGLMEMSRENLFRKTKKTTRKAPIKLILEWRLREARKLLRTTDMSAKQVAYTCGFTDPSYFSRQYRAFFKRPPGADRTEIHINNIHATNVQ